MTPTVHVLLYGQTLCRQIHGLPKDWGPQHKWVRVEERADATCAVCKRAAESLSELLVGWRERPLGSES